MVVRRKYNKCLRKLMYRKANYTCQCCGTQKTKENNLVLTIHHIKFVKYGGMATQENGLVCCLNCHDKIHKHLGILGGSQNFWQELANYLFTLPNLTDSCKDRFSGEEYKGAA